MVCGTLTLVRYGTVDSTVVLLDYRSSSLEMHNVHVEENHSAVLRKLRTTRLLVFLTLLTSAQETPSNSNKPTSELAGWH